MITQRHYHEVVRKKKYMAENTLRFFVALLMWIALQSPGSDVGKPFEYFEQTKSKRYNDLLPISESCWLLLAIVWYLAQLREGRAFVPAKKKTRKVKKKKQYLPSMGVIYQPTATKSFYVRIQL